jgi:hypothetical protein
VALEGKSHAHAAQDDPAKEMKREFRLVEIVAIATNAILAIVGLFALHAYYGQLGAMRGQLKEMRKATYVSCINAQTARNTLQEIQAGTGDSHNLATGSILQAAAVTRGEAAQEEFSLGEMPVRIHGYLAVMWGTDNVGRTPANNVQIRMMAVVVDKGNEPDFRYGRNAWDDVGTQPPVSPANLPTLQPQVILDDSLTNPKVFTPQEQDDIVSGVNKRIFFYGRVDYVDIFGVKHWTQYCRKAMGSVPDESGKWPIPKCAAYNRTDTNQIIAKSTAAPATTPIATPEEVVCKKPDD